MLGQLNLLIVLLIVAPVLNCWAGAASHANASLIDSPCRSDQFYCLINSECISKNKVCDFVKDCSNGRDESPCGTCDFEQGAEFCGFELIPDKLFTWSLRFRLGDTTSSLPRNMLQVAVDTNWLHFARRHKDTDLVYNPKILFPILRPTNNSNCRFRLWVRTSDFDVYLPKTKQHQESWPTLKLILIIPDIKLGRKRIVLRTISLTGGDFEGWHLIEIGVGVMQTAWTMIIEIDTKSNGHSVELTDFAFLGCHQIVVLDPPQEKEHNFDFPLTSSCKDFEFQCKISGLCIDDSLRCDFGLDCGEDDQSDELNCNAFPGRCDFEQLDKCDWFPSPSANTWLWTRAPLLSTTNQEILDNSSRIPTSNLPGEDHTYASRPIRGHYLLLNKRELIEKRSAAQLIGPRVALQPNSTECFFRFWLQTTESLAEMTSPVLSVGSKRLSSKEFLQTGGEWQRIEIDLLNDRMQDQVIDTLKLVLDGLKPRDLETFKSNDGYLAVDDFSFSSGCQLTFYGTPTESLCREDQFFCQLPTPVTNSHCIPANTYCDFKNDCGLQNVGISTRSDEISQDESDCPSVCYFDKDCKYTISGGQSESSASSTRHEIVNSSGKAFDWEIKSDGSERGCHLKITAQKDIFLQRFSGGKHKSSRLSSLSNDREFRLELPQFSSSHANCEFALDFEWSNDAEGLIATISLNSNAQTHSTFFKQLEPSGTNQNLRKTISFGIGEHDEPFKLIIEVSIVGSLEDFLADSTAFKGSFIIHSYKFLNCAHQVGILHLDQQVKFKEVGNDDDNNEDELDESNSFLSSDIDVVSVAKREKTSKQIDRTCPTEGQLQCNEPILCISEDLVCDMQLDCQGSKLDELDCTIKGSIQFDFDSSATQTWQNGKLDGQSSDSETLLWATMKPSTRDRHENYVGPPIDHTKRSDEGKFLAIKLVGGRDTTTIPASGTIYSPFFELSSTSSCRRLVFYKYLCFSHQPVSSDENKLETSLKVVLHEVKPNLEQIVTRTLHEDSLGSKFDSWQRVQIDLAREMEQQDIETIFRIEFRGVLASSLHSIAIDDVSFGPFGCKLSARQNYSFGGDEALVESDNMQTGVSPGKESTHFDLPKRLTLPCTTVLVLVTVAIVVVARRLIFSDKSPSVQRLQFDETRESRFSESILLDDDQLDVNVLNNQNSSSAAKITGEEFELSADFLN